MLELGHINRKIGSLLTQLGHADAFMIVDAGFPIPMGVKTIDVSIAENTPKVNNVLKELLNYFSVEKLVAAHETKKHNPSFLTEVHKLLGDVPIEFCSHIELKERSQKVRGVIRTGDFTAYANLLLVSGAGDRWYMERK